MPHSFLIPNDSSTSLNLFLSRRHFLKDGGRRHGSGWRRKRIRRRVACFGRCKGSSESLVKVLYDSLNETQRKKVCFGWDHHDTSAGLLRTRISANWHVTEPVMRVSFTPPTNSAGP